MALVPFGWRAAVSFNLISELDIVMKPTKAQLYISDQYTVITVLSWDKIQGVIL
ncbi:hypothetical protein KSZ_22230 [Dictyobacter formicarum]|uniref:Uncharacterized protein n=1 Tax=Dictyobacter formicarum TaxID=2778368 RepID=A0ABQ3VE83_9CHLR|nr:hypothetical protein KSZ_22230 [Dictyobacter formicarum]